MKAIVSVFVALAAGIAAAQNWKAGDMAPKFDARTLDGATLSSQQMLSESPTVFLYFVSDTDATSARTTVYVDRIASAYMLAKAKWFVVTNAGPDRARAWSAAARGPYRVL